MSRFYDCLYYVEDSPHSRTIPIIIDVIKSDARTFFTTVFAIMHDFL